jgi:hypothetical protein
VSTSARHPHRLRHIPANRKNWRSRSIIDTALALKHRGVAVGLKEVEKTYMAYKGRAFTPSELADLVVQCRGKSGSRELGSSD